MANRRVSPAFINSLKEDEIFVFGSNLSGIHGAGAAKQAMKWGAEWCNPFGKQGQTYAIPTKDKHIRLTLPPHEIGLFVDMFILYAKSNPGLKFLVTEIGCGLAGLKARDVAPLFKEAIEVHNIYLPRSFWHELQRMS